MLQKKKQNSRSDQQKENEKEIEKGNQCRNNELNVALLSAAKRLETATYYYDEERRGRPAYHPNQLLYQFECELIGQRLPNYQRASREFSTCFASHSSSSNCDASRCPALIGQSDSVAELIRAEFALLSHLLRPAQPHTHKHPTLDELVSQLSANFSAVMMTQSSSPARRQTSIEEEEKQQTFDEAAHLRIVCDSVFAFAWMMMMQSGSGDDAGGGGAATFIRDILCACKVSSNALFQKTLRHHRQVMQSDWLASWLAVLACLLECVRRNCARGLLWRVCGPLPRLLINLPTPPPTPPTHPPPHSNPHPITATHTRTHAQPLEEQPINLQEHLNASSLAKQVLRKMRLAEGAPHFCEQTATWQFEGAPAGCDMELPECAANHSVSVTNCGGGGSLLVSGDCARVCVRNCEGGVGEATTGGRGGGEGGGNAFSLVIDGGVVEELRLSRCRGVQCQIVGGSPHRLRLERCTDCAIYVREAPPHILWSKCDCVTLYLPDTEKEEEGEERFKELQFPSKLRFQFDGRKMCVTDAELV